jgi:uncharacterized protein YbjT (DUF2867 family)
MPVIVVGADTEAGRHAIDALAGRGGEVRAFVSDPREAASLKEKGVKAALGDVSDASHLGAASLGCYSAVLLPHCAFDGRDRAFASNPPALFAAWIDALRDAGIRRIIWVGHPGVPGGEQQFRDVAAEVAVVSTDKSGPAIGTEVARLDDLPRL